MTKGLPGKYNFSRKQGDLIRLPVRFRYRVWDDTANGGAGAWVAGDYIPLDGKTVNSQVRTEGGSLVATFDVQIGDQTISPGACTLVLLPADSAKIPGDEAYLYDVEIEHGPEDIQTVMEGVFTLYSDVTEVAV